MNKNPIIFHILFSTYYNDARVKTYTTYLDKNSIEYYVLCIEDTSTKDNIISLKLKKYQGNNLLFYISKLFKYLLFVIKEINKIINDKRIVILHCHNMPNFLVLLKFFIKSKSTKVILDNHDVMPLMIKSKINSKLLERIGLFEQNLSIAYSDHVICADHNQKDYLILHNAEAKKITPILNMPNKFIFSKNNIQRKQTDDISMVYHGTISYRLGQDLIIKALKINKENLSSLKFHLIGKSEYLNEIKTLVKEMELEDNVIIYDKFFSVEELPSIISQMHFGIIANREIELSAYMLPVKLLEYIVLGVPVIAPRNKILKRYFSEDMICFYEPENIEDMSNKIKYLYNDMEARTTYSQNAKLFLQQYNYDTEMEKYSKLLNHC